MKRYVLGFCFATYTDRVLLIKKNKPEWQKGRLNGIGGKIEEGETPLQAMVREAKEEADITPEWFPYGVYRGPGYEIFLFTATDSDSIVNYRSMTDEEVVCLSMATEVPWRNELAMIWNLNWMIPLALDHHTKSFEASET